MLAETIWKWKFFDPAVDLRDPARPRKAPPMLPVVGGFIDVEKLARTCLNCGAALRELKCKLVCACGFHVSCADIA